MTSQLKIEACRKNGRKSRGPVSAEGRLRSSMNALKHGKFSKKSEFLRENSLNFETRQHKWMANEKPRNDSEEFLIHRRVFLSFEVERSERAHLEHLRSRIDNAEENEHSAVIAIGERLFHDPSGHRSLYGIPPMKRAGVPKTSGNGEVSVENKPSELVKILESSEIGCLWLRSNWEELKARLGEPPNNFQSIDRFKAIRLLGRQPVEVMEHYSVAEIFVASHAIKPEGEGPYQDLQSDMTSGQYDVFVERIGRRWPELKSVGGSANAREILIDLCESKIEELNEKLAEYQENSDAIAEAKFNNLGTDETPQGRSMRSYALKCHGAYARVDKLLQQRQAKSKGEERRGYEEPRRVPDASRWPMDRANHNRPPAEEKIDISWTLEPYPGDEAPVPAPPPLSLREGQGEGLALRTADARGEAQHLLLPMGEGRGEVVSFLTPDAHTEGLSQSSFQPGDADGKTLEPVCQDQFAGKATHSQEISVEDALEEPRDEMTPQTENTENVRNEPKSAEVTAPAKAQTLVGVTANSGVKSELDKFGSFPGFTGQSSQRGQRELAAPRSQAPFKQPAPQTDGPLAKEMSSTEQ